MIRDVCMAVARPTQTPLVIACSDTVAQLSCTYIFFSKSEIVVIMRTSVSADFAAAIACANRRTAKAISSTLPGLGCARSAGAARWASVGRGPHPSRGRVGRRARGRRGAESYWHCRCARSHAVVCAQHSIIAHCNAYRFDSGGANRCAFATVDAHGLARGSAADGEFLCT